MKFTLDQPVKLKDVSMLWKFTNLNNKYNQYAYVLTSEKERYIPNYNSIFIGMNWNELRENINFKKSRMYNITAFFQF